MRQRGGLFGFRLGVAAALAVVAVLAAAAPVRAQAVVVMVDGVPITTLDIEQRTKLMHMGQAKPPTRQEVINELIDETLEIGEAKKFGIDVPASEINAAYANISKRFGADPDKMTQMLKAAGASEANFKRRLRAQLAWEALVRGRYKASLEVADRDIEAALQLHKNDASPDVGYEYTIRPIVFIVPAGSPEAVMAARKREADALRARFASCSDGLPFARALQAVAVRDQVIKFSADLPKDLRQILDSVEQGHLTAPETTSEGIQMFAICNKRETKSDTPERRQVRDELFQKKFGVQAKRYLEKIRQAAMIEYK